MSDTKDKQRKRGLVANLRPFRKNTDSRGPDPNINRKGRPKGFDELRKLAQEIAAENDGDFTVIYAMLKRLAKSRNGGDNRTFLEYAYGKPKESIDVTSGGEKIQDTKADNERFDRAILSLSDALREVLSGKGAKQDGEMDTPK